MRFVWVRHPTARLESDIFHHSRQIILARATAEMSHSFTGCVFGSEWFKARNWGWGKNSRHATAPIPAGICSTSITLFFSLPFLSLSASLRFYKDHFAISICSCMAAAGASPVRTYHTVPKVTFSQNEAKMWGYVHRAALRLIDTLWLEVNTLTLTLTWLKRVGLALWCIKLWQR